MTMNTPPATLAASSSPAHGDPAPVSRHSAPVRDGHHTAPSEVESGHTVSDTELRVLAPVQQSLLPLVEMQQGPKLKNQPKDTLPTFLNF